ncbi:MAG: glycerol-3-phosphate 1-O-acyltransferase PlsY [Gammaproteobacteria bacterium]|nr:glycerol-3-phosphate 1-O-acyltransferase PlsY [Gammaproteobacteria bacterium]MDD9815049.1 glycerol-3-phosphate 1-O-acyltransferase PlsY [Gammaproteobacteria bacterium]MDD9852228.1 glycerol-3-phosphate 1-O-acyltransferase PlsY [Gammaproteobacteria bacterium]MDD9870364.1 glycerol-3-phosphate 1-O-acyltransferase PlsY [Gammaproteobacteria bacterium]
MLTALLLICAYLLGSVSSGVLVSRAFGLGDPRGGGSGNPGATNVLRLGGGRAALLTLLGDTAKGLAAVLAAKLLSDQPLVWAAAGGAVFLGHLYPLFFGFRGGKGVATAMGALLGMDAALAALLLAVWAVMVALFRYSSLAALVAAAAAPFIAYALGGGNALIALCALLAGFLFWRHRANIARLAGGSESKVRWTKRSPP